MQAGIWLTWNGCKQRLGKLPQVSVASLILGNFLGIVAVAMWQQWNLTFGQDPEFLLSVSLVFAVALWLGHRRQLKQISSTEKVSIFSSVFGLAAWSILHPFWVDSLSLLMGYVPLTWLESPIAKFPIGISLAVLGWIIPGTLFVTVVNCASMAKGDVSSSSRHRTAFLMCGLATGLLLNSLVLAPMFGVYVPAVTAAVIACGVSWWTDRTFSKQTSSVVVGLPSRVMNDSRWLPMAMACFVGCLLGCNFRLINQLLPQGSFVLYVQLAGVVLGIAVGYFALPKPTGLTTRASWAGLLAAAFSTLLLAVQPMLVDWSMRMNSSMTSVVSLLASRVVMMMLIACPFGFALTLIAESSDSHGRANKLAWGHPFVLGLGCTSYSLGYGVGLFSVMSVSIGSLLVCAGVLKIRASGWRISFAKAIPMWCLTAMAVSLPLWRTCDDPMRTAKLLFSTPSLIAYRNGWDMEDLPYLDDVRMIDRREGRNGPITLWRGRVAELYVREAGLPRSVVSKQSNVVPQYPPEVLQAVYPLVLSDRPNRVMLLGISAGVPLTTCLNFPIREIVCFEGDSNLVSFVRGPLARETGFDPLDDDRATLHTVSPELAMMLPADEPFDVILSSPGASSLKEGCAFFTREFYQRAAKQLAERGLFCQRFESVDYGPKPLQVVLKSMRAAFPQVFAIETATGEFLLFGVNSEKPFIPAELATRLELPHVQKILSHSGLDWSVLLNLAAYDHAAIGEICDETRDAVNSTFNCQFAAWAPMEVLRWGNKYQEVQSVLTSIRESRAPFWDESSNGKPYFLNNEVQLSRRSRPIEWIGEAQVTKELLRRLDEVSIQQKLVRENPDEHWYKYRKLLRKQLQERPRTAVQQVKAIDEKQRLHPEDTRRRDYFAALGNAATKEKPTRKQIAAIEEFIEPYDPLLSYFAHQETAELLARSDEDAATELAYRLHVIYFVPALDASVRNVAKALITLAKHPEAIPDDSIRFDALNGLIQTLRIRWEIRQSIPEDSSTKILDDVDQSLIAVEKGVGMLDSLYAAAGVPERDWQTRKQVIERLMLRPLRGHRITVQNRKLQGQAQTKAILDEASKNDDE